MCPPGARDEDAAMNEAAAEAEYRLLLDRSLVPVCIHDGQKVLYVNPAAVETVGARSVADITGRPIADFIDPGSLTGVLERLVGQQADGDVSQPSEMSLLRADGTTLEVQTVSAIRMRRGSPTYEVIFRDPRAIGPAVTGDDPALEGRAPEAVIITNHDGMVTKWGADAHSLYGRTAHEVIGLPIERAVGAPLDPSVVALGGGREFTTHYGAKGAALAMRLLVVKTSDGFVVVCEAMVAAKTRERHFRAVLDLLHDGVVIMGSDGRFEFTNAAARRILGSPAEDLVGQHHSSSGADLPMYNAKGKKISSDAHPIRWIQKTGVSLGGDVVGVDRADGQRVWITGHGCLIDPGDPQNSSLLFSFTDMTEHFDARERLLHDATHDWLTGLPNRVHALNEAASALAETGAGRLSAVLFIDLDRLKLVNDSHGHPIGDDVLRVAAQRMRAVIREQDVVARIGGDEFVVLLMGPVTGDELHAITQHLHGVLIDDIIVGSLALRVGASIGVTIVAGDDERTLAEVLRDADTAMYQAKGRGPANTAYFEPASPHRDG